jgi:hypothetical protein
MDKIFIKTVNIKVKVDSSGNRGKKELTLY